MAARTPEEPPEEPPPPPARWPPAAAVFGAAALVLAVLVSNGRPIGAGDTRATERVAASLVTEGDFDLDEYPEVEPPFARTAGPHRVSIYPTFSAVLAAPVFLAARAAFALDETGTALAGKWAASLLSALAAAALFVAVALRHPTREAFWTAAVFALGTSVWSTSQALWQHPAAVLALCLALVCLRRAEDDPVWAGRTGLPLAAMVAARHADVAIAAILALSVAVRWPRALPRFAAWAAPPLAFVLAYQWSYFGHPLQHGFGDAAGRFDGPWLTGLAGLLLSPARGLFVFTPVALLAVAGLVRAARRERALALTAGAAALAHWALMGLWSEWHGGESWGPRLMTDALPLLFLFLPEAGGLLRPLGVVVAAASIGVQALGAFAYDYRWDRLFWRANGRDPAVLWHVADSPIPFYLQRRVAILAAPAVRDGKAVVRELPLVLGDKAGSRVTFAAERPRVDGPEPNVEDVHLQRGARVVDGRAVLRGRWDGVFLRVTGDARLRPLELRIAGRGQGVLYVGERTFWTEPRWTTYTVSGPFRLRHPYSYPTSGGADLLVTVGRGGGASEIGSIEVVGAVAR